MLNQYCHPHADDGDDGSRSIKRDDEREDKKEKRVMRLHVGVQIEGGKKIQ